MDSSDKIQLETNDEPVQKRMRQGMYVSFECFKFFCFLTIPS